MKARILLTAVLLIGCVSIQANPFFQGPGVAGFIVLAEQRYDPAVQRFMAEQSLRALPLQDGKLYYVFPTHVSNTHIEQMQIRYLETLLEKDRGSDEPEIE